MKKICLAVVGMYLMMLSAFSQNPVDTASYSKKKLTLEEVNLVSGYYNQDGNHSAVTGGIGTQKLSDVSNVIDLKFVKWNASNNKYSWNLELGVDHHTAASQAYISKSGASSTYGTRIYPSVNWQVEKNNGYNIGFGASLSSEYNYHSFSANFLVGKISKNKNTEINFKGQAFFDKVTMLEPSELVPVSTQSSTITSYTRASGNSITSRGGSSATSIPRSSRNTFAGSLTLSQVINKNMQVALITDAVAQNGFLSLPFHRVYFVNTESAKIENLPGTRLKLPLGLRLNYFLGDKVIFRSYYRYYSDSWGIHSNTVSLEVPYKISPFLSVSPFYRYYVQTAADYFAPYKQHSVSEQYYTSNYELSAFSSQFVGVNLKITPRNGVLNIPFFNTFELRYGRYKQTTGLTADNIGINLNFK